MAEDNITLEDKDRGEGGGDGGKQDGLKDEGFVYRVQSVGNCNLVDSFNSVKTGVFVSVSLFFSWNSSLSL